MQQFHDLRHDMEERALLVQAIIGSATRRSAENSIGELARLADTVPNPVNLVDYVMHSLTLPWCSPCNATG